jgi:predicted dienelactone hydrolase
MHLYNHALIGDIAKIPVSTPTPIMSFSPVMIDKPGRRVELQIRVTAPSTGTDLPIILLSHGHGRSNYLSSMEGYAPLAEFWAGHGFVVVQPTHLSSKSLNFTLDGGNIKDIFLESRAKDMTFIIDQLDTLESSVPFLKGRLDKTRIAVAGHSLGGSTASVLLGAVNTDPRDGSKSEFQDTRIKAGVLIGAPGRGGSDLSESGKQMIPFHNPDFTHIKTPTLVVWGDEDINPHLTTRGAEWHTAPYTDAQGPKSSLKIKGGQHGFGGISGWDAGETKDESPERLAVVQRMTWAYIKSQLYEGDTSWKEACKALEGLGEHAEVESKEN